jgi:hypothetical protein
MADEKQEEELGSSFNELVNEQEQMATPRVGDDESATPQADEKSAAKSSSSKAAS